MKQLDPDSIIWPMYLVKEEDQQKPILPDADWNELVERVEKLEENNN